MPLPADQGFVGCLLGVILMLVIIVIVLAIATATAYAQDVCAPKPTVTLVPDDSVSLPSATTGATATGRRDEPPAYVTAGRAHVADSRSAPPSDGQGGLLYLAVLVGVLVGRRSARRTIEATNAAETPPQELDAVEPPVRHLGAASITGPVRESNQDRVRTAHIADLDVIVVADGLGGLPRGGEAAEIAVSYAMRRLEAELPHAASAREEGVRALLMNIIWGAGVELACTAARDTWRHEEEGLRTTLILVVASADLYVAAWIGDGGVFIVRDDCATNMIEPHKSPATPDLLTASLGPRTEGRPGWAMARRHSGEVLAVATDGIADVIAQPGNSLPETVRDALQVASGDAEDASHRFVDLLARLRDADGHPPITDNLTLAILVTPQEAS